MALVSICMPVYNGQASLEKAIRSVLDQSMTDFELIVVDDASTDHTCDIVRSFCDDRVRLFHNDKNLGLVGNWNRSLELATGTYVGLFFQDDVMAPTNLQEKVSLMEENPGTSMCFSASTVIDGTGKEKLLRRPLKGTRVVDGGKLALRSFRSHNLYGEPSNVVMRMSAVRAVGPFREDLSYSPDWEYWIRLSIMGDVGYVDQPLCSFRVGRGSETFSLFSKRPDELAEDDRLLISAVQDAFGDSISWFDVASHLFFGKLRAFAKRVFLSLAP